MFSRDSRLLFVFGGFPKASAAAASWIFIGPFTKALNEYKNKRKKIVITS